MIKIWLPKRSRKQRILNAAFSNLWSLLLSNNWRIRSISSIWLKVIRIGTGKKLRITKDRRSRSNRKLALTNSLKISRDMSLHLSIKEMKLWAIRTCLSLHMSINLRPYWIKDGTLNTSKREKRKKMRLRLIIKEAKKLSPKLEGTRLCQLMKQVKMKPRKKISLRFSRRSSKSLCKSLIIIYFYRQKKI